jgi:hypothetical protein
VTFANLQNAWIDNYGLIRTFTEMPRFEIRLHPDLMAKLKIVADGRPLSAVVRKAIAEYLERQTKKEVKR